MWPLIGSSASCAAHIALLIHCDCYVTVNKERQMIDVDIMNRYKRAQLSEGPGVILFL